MVKLRWGGDRCVFGGNLQHGLQVGGMGGRKWRNVASAYQNIKQLQVHETSKNGQDVTS